MADSLVKIGLLSSPSVTVGDMVVDRFPTQRLVALLAYLVLHPTWKPREQIAEAIWPDQPEGKGLASLRNALSMLRRVLEPAGAAEPAIETSRTQARLSPGRCQCDVWEFQAHIQRHEFAAAIAAYPGDLLPDLYDEWLEPFREDLRNNFHAALAAEADRTFRAQEPDKTLLLTERWRKSDPFEAEAVKLQALALAATGRTSAALASLEKFESDFLDEFGEAPLIDLPATRKQIEAQTRIDPPPTNIEETQPPSPNLQAPEPKRDRRLPLYLSRFFGRESALEQIVEWSESGSSLLTILGTGGIGKTRLVVEASRLRLAATHDVVFIPLAGADSRVAMLAALMHAFGLREKEAETPEEILQAELSQIRRSTVVVLDNLEQIAPTAAALVLELLPSTPLLKLLCTSRELLGLEGEQILRLNPLEQRGDENDAAVQMFVDRARNTRADFALTSRNHEDVLALCTELDGLPLAIEIVAAWAGAWSVAQMRANVRDNKIVSRKRGHDPRHQSLEASIEWSFNLLEPKLQDFLCIQSLFRDGWTLEAAAAVAQPQSVEEIHAALVDRSLISSSEVEDGMRFSMLESVRVFCRSRLNPSTAREAATRFVTYFTNFAAPRTDPSAGAAERQNHRELDRERENFEVVASLCEEGLVSVEAAAFCAGQLHLHWTYRGQARVGIAMIERILAVKSDEEPGSGYLLALQGLCVLAHDALEVTKAEKALAELQALAKKQQNTDARLRALIQAGNFFNKYGRFAEALRHHSASVTVAKEMKNPRMDAVVHCNLAESLFGLDRLDEAVEHWRLATEFDRESGNIAGEAMLYLGIAECLQGNLASGADRLLLYLRNVHGLGFGRGYSRAVYYTAMPASQLGQADLAYRLTVSARAFFAKEGHVIDAIETKTCDMVDAVVLHASPDLSDELLPIEDAVALAERFLASAKNPK